MFVLSRKAAESALGVPLTTLLASSSKEDGSNTDKLTPEAKNEVTGEAKVKVQDLLLGETVGTGQFGMVKIARLKPAPYLYALKVWLIVFTCCLTIVLHSLRIKKGCSSTLLARQDWDAPWTALSCRATLSLILPACMICSPPHKHKQPDLMRSSLPLIGNYTE